MWDYINRGMPLGKEGSLKPDEVYALTAYLLFKNGVIHEDDVDGRAEPAEGRHAESSGIRAAGAGVEARDAAAPELSLSDGTLALERTSGAWPVAVPAHSS